jgi:stearoyl-CoA desaturase (delta-9 desaturase)
MMNQPKQLFVPNSPRQDDRIQWSLSMPFLVGQSLPFIGLAIGGDLGYLWLALAIYGVGMFFVTAGYHRYFSHRTFKTGRLFQFILAFGAQATSQKGILWWAGHHRHHHKHSDESQDVHSPRHGFFWSHMKWIMVRRFMDTEMDRVKDLSAYPELVWLNQWYLVPPAVVGGLVYWIGGLDAFLIGFGGGLFCVWHATFFVNSLAHVIGRKRYETGDDSRNSAIIAVLTLGEGWHNNHHYYQSSARQGFFWWEIDVTWYVLKALASVGVVWELREPSQKVRDGLVGSGLSVPLKKAA